MFYFFPPEPKAELTANMSPLIFFAISTVSFILTFSLKFADQMLMHCRFCCSVKKLGLIFF